MSELMQAMSMLINVFHKYSGKEGDKLTLSKGELKDLINTEMGNPSKNASNPTQVDKMFKGLDANADGVVDFKEYVTLVACVTMECNEFFKKQK